MNKNYTPDSVNYTKCPNLVYSMGFNELIHDSQRGIVNCPFGLNGSMNGNIFQDQKTINYSNTKWGRAPQMDPRPLAKIGLEYRV